MIVVLKEQTPKHEVDELASRLNQLSLQAITSYENGRFYISIVNGDDSKTDFKQFLILPYVEKVLPFTQKFKLAGREIKKDKTIIKIRQCEIGGDTLAIIAGPCSIESEEQIHQTAKLVAAAGANILRGGAFKPRTSPYDFQGLGEAGLRYMQRAAHQYNLVSITEAMDANDLDLIANYVDIIQIGARNMQNFSLLKQLGKIKKPILLKRGLSATYMEFLMAAEYILQAGNPNVILCERGIRTFETYSRNTLDIAAIPILHELTHLPIVIDPSHGTGLRYAVAPMAYAAVAAGANGIMIEVHPEPDKALSDSQQTISPHHFSEMMAKLRIIGQAVSINVP